MPTLEEGSEIERPAARHSISIRQPWPAIFGPPMIQSSGMKTSLPQFGPFWNTAFSGKWRRPMFTPGVVGRDQRAGDADVLLAAEQMVGVVEPEREAEQRRDRPERDVALLPGDAHAEDLAAFPDALADDADSRESPPRPSPRAGW